MPTASEAGLQPALAARELLPSSVSAGSRGCQGGHPTSWGQGKRNLRISLPLWGPPQLALWSEFSGGRRPHPHRAELVLRPEQSTSQSE